MAKKKIRGLEAFQAYYSAIWGDRWPQLEKALLEPVKHVAWWNPWCDATPQEWLGPEVSEFELIPDCYEAHSFPPPQPTPNGLMPYYLLDGASTLVTLLLDENGFTDILDLCAAPGGKSLQLGAHLWDGGSLTLNELSKSRFHRLKRVTEEYFPAKIQDSLRLTKHDATRWCLYEKDAYDLILLDAPCSSERHLLHDPKVMQEWSPSRSKQLAQRQYAMLASALDVVRVGGSILYMTCSISPQECDGVIEKLHKKRPGRFETTQDVYSFLDYTTYGGYMLPDETGWGPIYWCMIQRIS